MYANDDAIRHYDRALRTLAGCQGCDDLVQAVRERLADLWRSPTGVQRLSRITRRYGRKSRRWEIVRAPVACIAK